MAQPEPCRVRFSYRRPTYREYIAEITPLGATSLAPDDKGELRGGTLQCFVQKVGVVRKDHKLEIIFEADPTTGKILRRRRHDPFLNAPHFNQLPFRNLSFSQIYSVIDSQWIERKLDKQASAFRQAFNAMCQVTGADHLRWLMNEVHEKVVRRPEYEDCGLILSVHDSLVYEVPDEKILRFIDEARRVMRTCPPWATIDVKADVEAGKNLGSLKLLK